MSFLGVSFEPGEISAGVLVAFIVIAIIMGRLVPRSSLKDAQNERDLWRETALTKLDGVGELLEYARTADHVLRSLPVQPPLPPMPPVVADSEELVT